MYLPLPTHASIQNGNPMNCTLCDKNIEDYNPSFNQLIIDESHSIQICPECNRKIIKWQQTTYANLFPTKSAKKLLEKMRADGKGR
jgi:hypothetical protein